jgi:hypothetical protein
MRKLVLALCPLIAMPSLLAAQLVSARLALLTFDTPPMVTSTIPANGATGVPPGSTVTVNFSKAVNITAPGFKLECPAGTSVGFTVSPALPGGATSFVLHPGNLPQTTICTVTVVASQVADVGAGTHMPADYVFSFKTAFSE